MNAKAVLREKLEKDQKKVWWYMYSYGYDMDINSKEVQKTFDINNSMTVMVDKRIIKNWNELTLNDIKTFRIHH